MSSRGEVMEYVALDETPLISSGWSAPKGLPDNASHQHADFSSEFQAPTGIRPSIIFHLGQSLRYSAFPSQARDIFSVNVASTISLCDMAQERGARSVPFASTGSV